MELTTQEMQQRIIRALEHPKYEWRTIRGVKIDTELDEQDIARIIWGLGESGIVIQSSVDNQNGEALYTTRKHHRKKFKSRFLRFKQFIAPFSSDF